MNIDYRANTLISDEYILFERKMGDPETTKEQAERSIAHQLFSITAMNGGEMVGIARLIGDASIYFYINDVWVLPEYQGKGIIGKAMVQMLIMYIRDTAIPGTSVSVCLMCAKGKEGFYEKQGFLRRPHGWEGAGMELELDID